MELSSIHYTLSSLIWAMTTLSFQLSKQQSSISTTLNDVLSLMDLFDSVLVQVRELLYPSFAHTSSAFTYKLSSMVEASLADTVLRGQLIVSRLHDLISAITSTRSGLVSRAKMTLRNRDMKRLGRELASQTRTLMFLLHTRSR